MASKKRKETRITIVIDRGAVRVTADLAPPHDVEVPAALRAAAPTNARETTAALFAWVLGEADKPAAPLSVSMPARVKEGAAHG